MYDFEDGYEQGVEELISLIDGNRTKIQSIKTKWTNKAYIDINVYVTPISVSYTHLQTDKLKDNRL